jgi:phosphopantothenoylcysteine decarboxylase/phosphopantothenate--cysteine ligase
MTAAADQRPLSGYELLVCVTGGIAAYKTASLVSRLVQDGAGVTVAMTRSATRFVGPVTFRALTGRPVRTKMWGGAEANQMEHLAPADAADLIVVAPATANIIGKLAGGIADDLVSTLLLAADSPVIMAPAMNTRMWQHPAVQANAHRLVEWGIELVGPEDGWLACGLVGPGRMSDPDTIYNAVQTRLAGITPKRMKSSE